MVPYFCGCGIIEKEPRRVGIRVKLYKGGICKKKFTNRQAENVKKILETRFTISYFAVHPENWAFA